MMNAKMTLVQYSREDVIATSGGVSCLGAPHYIIESRDSSASNPGQHIFVYNAYEYDAVSGDRGAFSTITIHAEKGLRDKKKDEKNLIVWFDGSNYVECTPLHGQ